MPWITVEIYGSAASHQPPGQSSQPRGNTVLDLAFLFLPHITQAKQGPITYHLKGLT